MSKRRRTDLRRGVTLVEVLATMSMLLVIAIAAVGMLGRVTKIGLESKQADQVRANIARLAGQLREDVHVAEQVNLDGDGSSIELVTAKRTIRYRCDAPSLGIGRQAEEGKQTSREWFGLGDHLQPRFDVDNDQVRLELSPAGSRHRWIIEATRP